MALSLVIPAAIALASEFFPLLVTKIAGDKAGEVAEKVIDTAATIADLPENADVKDIISKIKGDKLALKEIQIQFELLNQQEHERILEDRQKAREYQIAVGPGGRWRGNIMLAGVTLGLIACIWIVIGYKGSIEEGVLALVTTIAGAFLKMFSDAFAFEFGSSRGSKNKDLQVREFKDALMQAGKDNQRSMMDVAKAQAKQLDLVEKGLLSKVAGANLSTTQQHQTPTSRDFVGDLIAGQI